MTSVKTTATNYFPTDDSNWKDTGCELYPACLSCPLPHCIEEKPRGKQKLRMHVRAGQMAALKRSGRSTREIGLQFSVSQRTVQRALATGGVRND